MTEEYRIISGGRWKLEDLYAFPHAFLQTYSFVYCLDSALDPRNAGQIRYALQNYPWGGGYSYVNLYNLLKTQVPPRDRPIVTSIRYSSPGWLDILVNPDVAIQVATSLGILMGTAVAAAKTYRKAYQTLLEINELRRKGELRKTEVTAARLRATVEASEAIANHLGFDSLKELNERTGSPEVSLRVLLAHYRRMETLHEFVNTGKAQLPEEGKKDT